MTCGSGSFIDRVVPDKPFGLVDFSTDCDAHDRMYSDPLTRNRLRTDVTFLHLMLLTADDAARWYKPRWLLSWLAVTYYVAVRLFGGSAWRKVRTSGAN